MRPNAVTIHDHTPERKETIRRTMRERLDQAGEIVVGRVHMLMRAPKTGAPIRRRKRKGRVRATRFGQLIFKARKGKAGGYRSIRQQTRRSAPGEAPAVQTGRLIGSVTHKPGPGATINKMTEMVGTNVQYGRYLEYGYATFSAKRFAVLLPRPWLHRALNESRTRIANILKRPIPFRTI